MAIICLALAALVSAVNETVFSARWHRVADLTPQCCADVFTRREAGQLSTQAKEHPWYLMSNQQTTLRINRLAWCILGRCDGRLSIDQIWRQSLTQLGDLAPTQDETIDLLVKAIDAGLVQCDAMSEISVLKDRSEKKQSDDFSSRFSAMSFKFDLGNPHRLLTPAVPAARLVFSPLGALAFCVLAVWSVVTLLNAWPELASHTGRIALDPSNWVIAWLLFIPIKFVHELAHALCALRYGAGITQAGVSMMLIFPAPFVDISSANGLSSSRQKSLISSSGILAELCIAAIALQCWIIAEPGQLRDALAIVMTTAGASTLLFNANPLIKMDGYFVLSDLLELPNLAQRSQLIWSTRLQNWLTGSSKDKPSDLQNTKRFWLEAWAPASWIWRWTIYAWACLWLGSIYQWLGFGILLAGLITLLGKPMLQMVRAAHKASPHAQQTPLIPLRAIGLIALILAPLCLLPVPDRALNYGQVWLPETQTIKALGDGFISEPITVANGAATDDIKQWQLSNPSVTTELLALQSQRAGLQSQLQQALVIDVVKAQLLSAQLDALNAKINLAAQRRAELYTRATEQSVQWLHPADLPGRWVTKGQVLGYASTDHESAQIKLVLNQDDAARLSEATQRISVRLASDPDHVLPATLERKTPAAIEQLPNQLFGSQFGGPIATAPNDNKFMRPAAPSFVFDLQLGVTAENGLAKPSRQKPIHAAKVTVMIDYGSKPLASQLYRQCRQVFRSQFAIEPV